MEEIEQTNDVEQEADVAASSEPQVSQDKAIDDAPGGDAKNFRELRRILKEQQTRIRELEQVAAPRYQEALPPEEEEESINPDDIPTWKQVQKAIKKEAEKRAREIVGEHHAMTAEDRFRAKNRDYDEVVTEDNVRQLVDDDPVLADTIRNSPNPYEAAYKLIKKTSFYKKPEGASDAKRIQENAKKPVSSNAVKTERPLAAAHSWATMGESDRNALYKEMQDCARRRS